MIFELGRFRESIGSTKCVIMVTSILMEDEKYSLHDWERNHIIPKDKGHTCGTVSKSDHIEFTLLS